jgi:hypothetical protein
MHLRSSGEQRPATSEALGLSRCELLCPFPQLVIEIRQAALGHGRFIATTS